MEEASTPKTVVDAAFAIAAAAEINAMALAEAAGALRELVENFREQSANPFAEMTRQ